VIRADRRLFLFPDISEVFLETQGNMPAGQQKDLVKIVNHTVKPQRARRRKQ
jgi:hypothetical protein